MALQLLLLNVWAGSLIRLNIGLLIHTMWVRIPLGSPNIMKPKQEIYDKIPTWPRPDWFMDFPGVYCKGCGETFALYSFSMIGKQGLDENNKAYMNSCFKCQKDGPITQRN